MNKGSPTRQRILDASRQLFNSRGYAKTTLAEIAAEVGIAEGNLWYHFRTKRDLVIALGHGHRDQLLAWDPSLADRVVVISETGISDPIGGDREVYRRCALEIGHRPS